MQPPSSLLFQLARTRDPCSAWFRVRVKMMTMHGYEGVGDGTGGLTASKYLDCKPYVRVRQQSGRGDEAQRVQPDENCISDSKPTSQQGIRISSPSFDYC